MSSVKKGNDFEEKAYKCFLEQLGKDNLFIPKSKSTIFRKKAYYSRERESNIIIDISIETYLPGATDYSILTVIECKDYNSSIPVDDIQELHDKVRQIAGDKGKAIFVTNSALQKSAFSYAKNNKIAIARILPDDQVDWELYLMTPEMTKQIRKLSPIEFDSAFLNQQHQGRNREFYAIYDKYIYGDINSLVRGLF